jgi:hypothetical protein
VHIFAPSLAVRVRAGAPPPEPPLIAEVPAAAAGAPLARMQAVSELYPELSVDQIQRLAGSRERFMVVRPGALAALGLAAGDLLAAPAGESLASRAALARRLARGGRVKLIVERAGQRYLLASRND